MSRRAINISKRRCLARAVAELAAGGAGAGGASGLDAELAQLRAERAQLRQVETGVKGCMFVALEPEVRSGSHCCF
jgi:hypothetical protein